jgi:hypothetical protein
MNSTNGTPRSNGRDTRSSTAASSEAAQQSPRRRRTRPPTATTTAALTTTTATMTTSWSAVKQDFIKTVSGAVKELMEHYGYSRDRATAAVLREISAGGKLKTPDDVEVGSHMMCCVCVCVCGRVPATGAGEAAGRRICDTID